MQIAPLYYAFPQTTYHNLCKSTVNILMYVHQEAKSTFVTVQAIETYVSTGGCMLSITWPQMGGQKVNKR